jgi:hypothetical protein
MRHRTARSVIIVVVAVLVIVLVVVALLRSGGNHEETHENDEGESHSRESVSESPVLLSHSGDGGAGLGHLC